MSTERGRTVKPPRPGSRAGAARPTTSRGERAAPGGLDYDPVMRTLASLLASLSLLAACGGASSGSSGGDSTGPAGNAAVDPIEACIDAGARAATTCQPDFTPPENFRDDGRQACGQVQSMGLLEDLVACYRSVEGTTGQPCMDRLDACIEELATKASAATGGEGGGMVEAPPADDGGAINE